jgi:hypothetical protein
MVKIHVSLKVFLILTFLLFLSISAVPIRCLQGIEVLGGEMDSTSILSQLQNSDDVLELSVDTEEGLTP